jgi:hypothetical protein
VSGDDFICRASRGFSPPAPACLGDKPTDTTEKYTMRKALAILGTTGYGKAPRA